MEKITVEKNYLISLTDQDFKSHASQEHSNMCK